MSFFMVGGGFAGSQSALVVLILHVLFFLFTRHTPFFPLSNTRVVSRFGKRERAIERNGEMARWVLRTEYSV